MKNFLTKREYEIFSYLAKNYSTAQIAEKLNINVKTVRNHISNTILKLGVRSRTQAVVILVKNGMIKI
jgi:LuxR family transcriptional regulator of spore coat protein